MGEITHISWCDHTWSPWIGCTKISPACDGCYAAHLMDTRLGRVEWGPRGERSRTSSAYWRHPLAWERDCAGAGRRESVFPSLCDPFDNQADPVVRHDFFHLIRQTPHLDWLLLTKRPQNIIHMVEEIGFLPPNMAFGATVEDQKRAETNVLALLEAAFRLRPAFTFVSCEPLLGPVDLRRIEVAPGIYLDALSGAFTAETASSGGLANYQAGLDALPPLPERRPSLGWVISGGETSQGKHHARPSHPDWFRALRDACAATFTPYHHKQNGEFTTALDRDRDDPDWRADYNAEFPDQGTTRWLNLAGGRGLHGERFHVMRRVGKKVAGRLLDGVEHSSMPLVAGALT